MATSIADVDGGDDSEESSSSNQNEISENPQQALDDFREQWKSEIKSISEASVNKVQKSFAEFNLQTKNETEDIEEKAKNLFLQGVELEKKGKVFDAIGLYRRSIQLVPDIEVKIYEMSKMQTKAEESERSTHNDDDLEHPGTSNEEEDEEDLTGVDLMLRFQNYVQRIGQLVQKNTNEKVVSTTSCHFCNLPMEIILYIFRWVVSNDLDVRSLDTCSRVCKGFYICARDPELWRAACVKVWGVNAGILEGSIYSSWRQMFYERYRVLFSGCYISKTSYLRSGENSFQDQFYRPIHLVEYFRFIRFFPDGTLFMFTSSDDPQQSVTKLRYKNSQINDPSLLTGHYRLHNDEVIIILKPRQTQHSRTGRRGKQQIDDSTKRTFYIEMKIVNSVKRKFCKLEWSHYSVIQIRDKTEVTSEFDLTATRYPPFWFSRVKSYHSEADAALS